MPLKVLYGINSIPAADVTSTVIRECMINNRIIISSDDHARNKLFGDPYFGKVKEIIITYGGNTTVYPVGSEVDLDLDSLLKDRINKEFPSVDARLQYMHDHLIYIGDNINDKWILQKLVLEWVSPTDKVLELGANTGKTSLIIASLLDDSSKLVSHTR